VSAAALGSAQRRPNHSEDDRAHREVLAPAGVLAEHALAEEQEHEQSHGQRRLNQYERGEQEREDLQWPSEHRQAGPCQPARPSDQVQGERRMKVLGVRGPLGVHRLQRDP
jgi:hypothetical protein